MSRRHEERERRVTVADKAPYQPPRKAPEEKSMTQPGPGKKARMPESTNADHECC
jgi:hypothetical protein